MNAYTGFAEGFAHTLDASFLEDEAGRVYSYADLERATARVAAFLTSLRLSPGARVAVQIEKSVDGLFLYLGTLRAGYCFLPLNPAYQKHELEYFLTDARPELVVCSPGSPMQESARTAGVAHTLTLGLAGLGTLPRALAATPAEFGVSHSDAETPAVMIYTSGTTGRAKGALITHHNLLSNARVLREHWQISAADVLIHALPLFHVHGLFVALHPLLCAGAKLLFHAKFDARSVSAALPAATLLMGVPTFYTRLLKEPALNRAACRNMRLFISGSAPLLEETFHAFEARTGHTILERYGMSEAGMITSNPYLGERRAGTVGQPLPGVSLRVVDEHGQRMPTMQPGGIEIQGPNVFAGYFGMPEKTRESFSADGFFKTGDIGVLSADGYLTIVGRATDLIISGGYNVYPKELELVIDAFPEVLESAVVGLAHADFGEAVAAAVVLRAGATLSEAELLARLKSLLAGYKIPKRVHLVAELPRNAMGKVQKNELRRLLAGVLEPESAPSQLHER